jgi:hypothetical protein
MFERLREARYFPRNAYRRCLPAGPVVRVATGLRHSSARARSTEKTKQDYKMDCRISIQTCHTIVTTAGYAGLYLKAILLVSNSSYRHEHTHIQFTQRIFYSHQFGLSRASYRLGTVSLRWVR